MKKVLLKGPVLTQSGYGHHARTVLRALRTREDLFDIYIHPITWGQTSWMWEDNEERRYIDNLLEKTIKHTSEKGTFDVSLQVTIPNEWEKIAPVNIGITAGIETTKVSPKWVENSYLMDKIITISEHSKWSYENTKVNAINQQTGEQFTVGPKEDSIDYVSYPVRKFEPSKVDLDLQTDFNFLAVAQLSARKNVDQLIKCFVDKFGDNENVGLIIKANMAKNSLIDRKHTLAGFKRVVQKYSDRKCKIYLLHGYLSDNEMAGLYTHPKIKALVSTSHGEGFGLPLFEAAYYGLPVIATDWSGHLDFLYKPTKQKNGKVKKKHMFSRISYTLGPVQESVVWNGVIEKDSMWAYPEEGSIKMNLEEMYKDHGRFKKRAKELQKWVCEEFSEEKQYNQFLRSLDLDLLLEPADYIFVSDMFADQFVGGAELSLQALIDSTPIGKNSIKLNSTNISKSAINLNKDSTWVFGNIAQMNEEMLHHVVKSGIKYYFVEFDYKFCEYRNPVLYEFLEDEKCDYAGTDRGKLLCDFINHSQKTFFMSREQKRIYLNNFKNLDNKKLLVLSSVFDEEFFNIIENLRSNKQKTDKWLVLGSRSWVKGAAKSEQWCKDNNLEYEVVYDLPYKQMLAKLAESKGICFKPTGLDTCPRYVIEAKLLGCELELNQNVQHTSEEWFSTDDYYKTVSYLKGRKKYFWSEVKDIDD